jgi:branched-chain amino acid transport system ATP-binding protein
VTKATTNRASGVPAAVSAHGLHVHYGAIRAVQGASVEVRLGTVTALVGSNGAGKSSFLHAVAGLVGVAAGRVTHDGSQTDITRMPSHGRVRDFGIVLVPEGRGVLPRLSVLENLNLGLRMGRLRERSGRAPEGPSLDDTFALFPQLRNRRQSAARLLSGGEQQMLSIARALLMRPKVLLIDEPSTGLSPKIAKDILVLIAGAARRLPLAVLLVEQDTRTALEVASFAYVMERGQIVLSGPATDVAADAQLEAAYLGRRKRVPR